MRSFDLEERQERLRRLDRRRSLVVARFALALSALMLAGAPLIVGPSYSFASQTLSQAGGQGVDGAWVHRLGVALAAGAVVVMIGFSKPQWGSWARRWMTVYTLALLLLIAFPAPPWDGSPFDSTVSTLHTAAAVSGGVAFILGVVAISVNRPRKHALARSFDWLVALSIAVIPQLMLMSEAPGLLQRLMVAMGYLWLLAEAARLSNSVSKVTREDSTYTGG